MVGRLEMISLIVCRFKNDQEFSTSIISANCTCAVWEKPDRHSNSFQGGLGVANGQLLPSTNVGIGHIYCKYVFLIKVLDKVNGNIEILHTSCSLWSAIVTLKTHLSHSSDFLDPCAHSIFTTVIKVCLHLVNRTLVSYSHPSVDHSAVCPAGLVPYYVFLIPWSTTYCLLVLRAV